MDKGGDSDTGNASVEKRRRRTRSSETPAPAVEPDGLAGACAGTLEKAPCVRELELVSDPCVPRLLEIPNRVKSHKRGAGGKMESGGRGSADGGEFQEDGSEKYPMPWIKEVDAICEGFGVLPEYRPVVEMFFCLGTLPRLAELERELSGFGHCEGHLDVYAAFLNVSRNEFAGLLAPGNPLGQCGLIVRSSHDDWPVSLSEPMLTFFARRGWTPAKFERFVRGEPLKTSLRPKDFAFCKDYGIVRDLLKGALAGKCPGIHVFIYGCPGSGKTELAKVLCKDIGASLFNVAESPCGDSDCLGLCALNRGMRLAANRGNTVLLAENAGEFFSEYPYFRSLRDKVAGRVQKGIVEGVLKNNPVSVIWTDCSAKWLKGSGQVLRYMPMQNFDFLSNFALIVNLKSVSTQNRGEVIRKIAKQENIALTKIQWEYLRKKSKALKPTLGMIRRAMKNARIACDPDMAAETLGSFREFVVPSSEMSRKTGFPSAPPENFNLNDFSIDLLNPSQDLKVLADRLSNEKSLHKFSMCLYGAPGTGKSYYAYYLAERLGMKVLQKRASDLLGRYIGDTEKRIAMAFAEARDEKKMLVFNEADSLLRNRMYARYNWEVSQVNEMLTQMDVHPFPFVCTTNLMEDIDEASLRRFTFKVSYGYMKLSQIPLAFQHFFGFKIEGDYSDLTELAPSDFVTVRDVAKAFGVADNPLDLVSLLRTEQANKGSQIRMGFNK